MRGIGGRSSDGPTGPTGGGGGGAGAGVSGRMDGAGCVCLRGGRSRGPCGRKRRRESRTSGRWVGGLSIRRVTRGVGAIADPLACAPFHHGSGVGIIVPDYGHIISEPVTTRCWAQGGSLSG